jgi:RND superfamily putative drug exporter
MQGTLQTIESSFDGLITQMQQMTDTATAMGEAFDASKSDDYFYLPPEVFANPDFQKGLKLFLSPDGKAARLIITHDVDPASEEGISVVDDQLVAAHEAIKGTALAEADVYLTGTAATYRDIQSGAKYDTMIAAFAALTLIFIVMLILTRALVASMVIVGTVVISLGAAFGLSVLIWERLIGMELNWIVLAFAVIILMAVGSDYNLLLVSRFKEEIGAGINTGIIRSMGSTGSVVTAAGLVFAFTMGSMAAGDLLNVGQGGTTIGIGLLLDLDRAIADDAVDRGDSRAVVLVAAEGAVAARLLRTNARRDIEIGGTGTGRRRRTGCRPCAVDLHLSATSLSLPAATARQLVR